MLFGSLLSVELGELGSKLLNERSIDLDTTLDKSNTIQFRKTTTYAIVGNNQLLLECGREQIDGGHF